MATYFLLIIGFIALVAGANILVTGASSLAHKFNLSEMVIGLTIVSFGTSVPELVVSIEANLGGHPGLAIANVLGSNIANVLLILGVAAVIKTLPVDDATVLSEIPFSLTAALLVGYLANVALFSASRSLTISRLDGVILLFFFALFLIYVVKMAKSGVTTPTVKQLSPVKTRQALLMIGFGLACLMFGGQWVVDAAISIARKLHVSDAMIGLTVVGVGTSLPELFASGVAAYRGNTAMAVGNVVGSNIFNLLWILGATAVVGELPFDVLTNTDLSMVVFATSLVLVAIAMGRRRNINRLNGIVFMVVYAAYLAFVVNRG